MLAEMRIQGLGVIDEATLQLDPGFTVVTGETGAGKTMVVTGLHLLSGGRAEASRVRSGASRAVVEGRFHVPPDSRAAKVAVDAAAEPDEDGSLIALRTVGSDGRSRAHLGGRSVPVGVLSELAEQLIAVHGQNDQLRLLHPAEQRAVLDTFAGDAVAKALAEYRSTRAEWLDVIEELREKTERARELAKQADMLQHGLKEIEAVDPKPGEDTALVDEARRLADVDQLREAAAGAHFALSGSPDDPADGSGALSLIDEARRRLSASEDPKLRDLEPRLAEAAVLVSDVNNELSSYVEGLEADPARLEQVLARQAELKMLTRKHATDIDGVLAWAADAAQQLTGLDTSEEALTALASRRDALAAELARHASTLTEQRERAAQELSSEVTAELAGLAMGSAGIDVAVRPRMASADDVYALQVGDVQLSAGPDGVDEVELRLKAHDGAQALPVHKAASGGELSRVMLAIEVVLAHADPVPTMVFDEVDAGVGGRAAIEIGRRLARLARSHQVVVVTHLAQVAAFADRHLVVDKSAKGGLTKSGVKTLSAEQRVVELARMLAGMESTETGRAHAEELLGLAETVKREAINGKKSRRKRS
ncbi:DNA repair protein RecN [Kibdelosporangium phytohabitans]|uniref:DNA repair protein RecN n=1 Tax=Kibdelosporangium phytohabitans TaxID=860235 RepID=A0A0N9HMR0_9PSEU|nr:DNA repair protein RecN [Kibdelosporangium phytohabitans]ALG08120.1 DNA repair protein RecN [Kibdelosporangium phytohabitans]MBE1470899.1 DNA repair protein RecN (Recombination protein N) [Kibdelosporangium phytohabitans]